jgi:hypothetical protein
MAKSNPLFQPAKYGLFTAVVLATGCGGGSHTEPAIRADLDVRIERLDQDLFNSAKDSVGNFSLKLHATYGSFYQDYVERILQAAPLNDPRLPMQLIRFAMDPDWSSVQLKADTVFGDMEQQRAEFEEAFERLKGSFPDSLSPRIIVFNSGFNFGVIPTDSVLGIGVEWFVGKDSKVVQYLAPDAFPQYVKERMQPEMLVPSAVKGWLQVHYTKDVRGEDLLTNLVEIGKVLYLLDALLPETNPALKFAFTDAQMKWCEDNEFNVWRELIAKEQLYSKKGEDIDRLLNDGPFTNGFPKDSPGHIGEWIGYQLVKSYMDDHAEITMAQLFQNTDVRSVLKSYKPR